MLKKKPQNMNNNDYEKSLVSHKQDIKFLDSIKEKNNNQRGIYKCNFCGLSLFKTKDRAKDELFQPSFYQPIAEDRVLIYERFVFGLKQMRVFCRKCKESLGYMVDRNESITKHIFFIYSKVIKFELNNPEEKNYNYLEK